MDPNNKRHSDMNMWINEKLDKQLLHEGQVRALSLDENFYLLKAFASNSFRKPEGNSGGNLNSRFQI
jgi:hypothetical protein